MEEKSRVKNGEQRIQNIGIYIQKGLDIKKNETVPVNLISMRQDKNKIKSQVLRIKGNMCKVKTGGDC